MSFHSHYNLMLIFMHKNIFSFFKSIIKLPGSHTIQSHNLLGSPIFHFLYPVTICTYYFLLYGRKSHHTARSILPFSFPADIHWLQWPEVQIPNFCHLDLLTKGMIRENWDTKIWATTKNSEIHALHGQIGTVVSEDSSRFPKYVPQK